MDTIKLITEYGAPLLALVVAPVLSALGVIAAHRLGQWLGVKVTAEQESVIDDVVSSAVAYGEERAVQWAKSGEAHDGADKLREAARWAADEARRRRLPQLASDQIVDLIEAKLGDQRSWKQ